MASPKFHQEPELLREASSSPAKVDPNIGAKIFYPLGIVRVVAISYIVFMTILLAFMIVLASPYDQKMNLTGILVLVLTFGFFLSLGVGAAVLTFKARVIITEEGITTESLLPWHPRHIAWNQVTRVCIGSKWGDLVVLGQNKYTKSGCQQNMVA
jgi:hypothetical protein